MLRHFVILILGGSTCSAVGRQKRLLDGIPIEDRRPYAVINYMVWIGFGREVHEQALCIHSWKADRLTCGGALITPHVVQSACHCFCHFEGPREAARAVWRDQLMEFVVGHSKVIPEAINWDIDRYIIHPMCMTIAGFITHDFALLVNYEGVTLGPTVTTAPVYPMIELAMMWKRMFVNQLVCLLVGWGRYLGENIGGQSPVLRHAWTVTNSINDCFRQKGFSSITDFIYSMSKSCYSPFPHLGAKFAASLDGDSGSPVTCDNIYVGVHSQRNGIQSFMDGLVFYAFANTMDYRDAFAQAMREEDPGQHNQLNDFYQENAVLPDTPPPNFGAVVAKSVGNIIRFPDLFLTVAILSTTVSLFVFKISPVQQINNYQK